MNLLQKYCESNEIIVFERTTFLILTYLSTREGLDDYRFEKISNIIKQFKLECRYSIEFSIE